MENENIDKSESNDTREIAIIVAIGAIVIVCICCLLIVAGYFLYNDLNLSATASPKSTPAITLVPTQSSSNGSPFSDEFNSNTHEWNEGTFKDEYGTVTYTINGDYTWELVADKAVNQKSLALQAPSVEDFIVSVDATHVSGAENASYGIVFRMTDTNNMYYFCISDTGYYYVGLLKDSNWTTLVDWKETTTININAINLLKVIGKGDEFTFYINDHEVERVKDGNLPEGTAGLAVELYDPGDTSTFVFDNFIIETP
jgi:hypothetical protein